MIILTGRLAALLSAAALLLAVTPASIAQDAGAPVTLKLGLIPIVDVAPVYLGMQKGYFQEQKLTIEPVMAQGGAAIVPAVVSGDEQIGFSNVVSLMLAASRNLPLQGVIAGAQAGTETTAAMMVAKNSPVRGAKDLEGKTVAVNALSSIAGTTAKAILERGGADVSKIKFVELGFPEMPAALREGRVDAATINEPFVSVAKAEGERELFDLYRAYDPHLTIAAYFTTQSYAAQHPDVVRRFRAAMAKSLTYAAAHPAEARAILATFTKLEPKQIESIALTGWGPAADFPSLEKLQNDMVRYQLLTTKIDLRALFPAAR